MVVRSQAVTKQHGFSMEASWSEVNSLIKFKYNDGICTVRRK